MPYVTSIEDVVDTLRNAQNRARKCTLLIGAGCSVKAGIPTAAGIVDAIKKGYPRAYSRATAKTYPKCMAELAPGQRRDLIAHYVDLAKLNWAHIGIAQLMKRGYINRVLTTNFDPLVTRACAMVGVFPAIYDFAASQRFKPADIPDQAVFYLHGQRTGFVLLHTDEEVQRHSDLLAPVFEDAGRGRVWLVVGYSGENDPVFNHLASVSQFDHNLYWVGYRDSEPAKHIRDGLLVDGKYAFYISGFDADDFFVTLAQKLDCFPPDFIGKPLSYLEGLMEILTPYTIPDQGADIDVTAGSRQLIQSLKPNETALMADFYLMAGNYDQVIALRLTEETDMTPELSNLLSWSYVMQGVARYEQARTKTGAEADGLFAQAGEKYQAALTVKPDKHEALYNWGVALSDQAKTKTGAEADRLFAQAGEKYEAALTVKPDDHKALNNWGNALYQQAKTKTGAEADGLFAQAGEKYEAALTVKPDDHEALYNWGNALSEQAKTKTGAEADRLFAKAKEKWLEAEAISPGIGAYNLACIHALRREETECREWLEKSHQCGELPSREHLEKDSDLDSVRGQEWFKAFLATL